MMRPLRDESVAFRTAQLKSERLRIYVLLAALASLLLVRILRTLIAWNPENAIALFWVALLALLLGGFEVLVLRALAPALRTEQALKHPLWMLNIYLEACFPALGLAFLVAPTMAVEYRPLAHPAFLLYFLILILSTLRLSPRVCLLSGLFAALSYLLASASLGWSPTKVLFAASLFSPPKIVFTYALSLLVGGGAAALVSREIHKQVEAALREAETRREVERLQHDLDVARSIQQSLLPRTMPEMSGFEIAAWNQPADQTGGDYYDWQALPGGRIVFALADVTGHGIGPALLASVCRAYARANFARQDGLFSAMEQINSAIAADVGEGRFVTFVAAILGPSSSTIELLSAGHAPLFVYWFRPDRFDRMEADGLPLGISPALLSEPPKALALESGDLLVLATDGFFEWANPAGELFGSQRLETSIRANRDKTPSEIISALYHDVLQFAGGTKQMDDLTAIVIKRV